MLWSSFSIGPRSLYLPVFLCLLFAIAPLIAGCATSRSPAEIASDRQDVLGTWEYQTNGTTALQRGTLRITVDEGNLVGVFEDSWRGELNADVSLYGSHMELSLDRVRISGRFQNGRFEASIQQEYSAVSLRSNRRRAGYFIARRIRSASTMSNLTDVGCTSLLRESSYMCSPFELE